MSHLSECDFMPKKPAKPAKPTPDGRKKKAQRMTRIPEAYAVLLEELAEADHTTLAEMVRLATKDYLVRHGKLPAPAGG